MRSQILKESIKPISGDELAAKLEIDRSTPDGMLLELVKQGKLREVRQMKSDDCHQEIKSVYGDICAFIGSADDVVHYEIASESEE